MNKVYEASGRTLKVGDLIELDGGDIYEMFEHEGQLCLEVNGQIVRGGNYSSARLVYKGAKKYTVCMIHHVIECVYLGSLRLEETKDLPDPAQLIEDYFEDYTGDLEDFVKTFCEEMDGVEVPYNHDSSKVPIQVYVG